MNQLVVQPREAGGIRELLDANPMVGEARKGTRRFWTGREEKILREYYSQGGPSLCLQYLPGRSLSSIYNRAGQLGLRVPNADGKVYARQVWKSSEALDAIIVRTFQTRPDKGAVMQLAQTIGRPRWWVSKRAAKLGLVAPRFKEPAWSEAEIEIICEHAHRNLGTLRKMLKRAGYERTETAIAVKLKRLGADRTDPNHLNANQLSVVMGVDRKTVAGWVARGLLKATRRAASDKDDFWSIHRRDIRRFVIDNVAAVDLRKVDKFWFIDLMAERMP